MTEVQTATVLARWARLRKTVELEDGSRRVVLDLPEMSIPRGAMVCVLGPSGSGKTTLLAILGQVDRDFEGEMDLVLGGRSWRVSATGRGDALAEAQEMRRHIGFVFQDIRLRPDVDALRNVADPLVYLGRGTPATRLARAAASLSQLGIGAEDQRRRVSSFSGGMQQRTAIARAVAAGPELLCADEPTANLDSGLADEIYRELRISAERRGISVVVVTHDEVRARRFAHWIVRVTPHSRAAGASAAADGGKWPFDVAMARNEPEQMTADPARPALPDIAGTPLASRVGDMLKEGGAELRHLPRGLLSWVLAPFGWVGRRGRRSPAAMRVPDHLFVPQLAAIATFSLLAAVGFLFSGVRAAITGYLDGEIGQLNVLRRVRVISPGDAAGALVDLDLPALSAFTEGRGAPIAASAPHFELWAWGMPPGDERHLAGSGELPPAMLQQVLPERWASAGGDGSATDLEESRLTLQLIRLEPGEPLAEDLGVNEVADYGTGEEALPGLFITPNAHDWMNVGGFSRVPEPGAEIPLVFRSVPSLRIPPTGSDTGTPDGPSSPTATEPSAEPALLCLRAKVAGHFARKPDPRGFASTVDSAVIHGALRGEVRDRILAWQYDPLAAGSGIPERWRCAGHGPPPVSASYADPAPQLRPVATRYDLYATGPRDVPALIQAIEAYGREKGLNFDSIVSEREFIAGAVRLMNVVEAVGWLLVIVPISVGTVVLWLVVHGILLRRRDTLLLFDLFGAPRWQLMVQSTVIAWLIVVPSLAIGFVVGDLVPPWIAPLLPGLGLPDPLIERIERSHAGMGSLLAVSAFALALSGLAARRVVRSIMRVNPADVFRGTI